jgi:hypothetical protein
MRGNQSCNDTRTSRNLHAVGYDAQASLKSEVEFNSGVSIHHYFDEP